MKRPPRSKMGCERFSPFGIASLVYPSSRSVSLFVVREFHSCAVIRKRETQWCSYTTYALRADVSFYPMCHFLFFSDLHHLLPSPCILSRVIYFVGFVVMCCCFHHYSSLLYIICSSSAAVVTTGTFAPPAYKL